MNTWVALTVLWELLVTVEKKLWYWGGNRIQGSRKNLRKVMDAYDQNVYSWVKLSKNKDKRES